MERRTITFDFPKVEDRRLLKFTIPRGGGTVSLPKGSIVVKVGVQRQDINLWAMVVEGEPFVDRTFRVFPTGGTVPGEVYGRLRFIDTVFQGIYIGDVYFPAEYVWHVFEEVPDVGP